MSFVESVKEYIQVVIADRKDDRANPSEPLSRYAQAQRDAKDYYRKVGANPGGRRGPKRPAHVGYGH